MDYREFFFKNNFLKIFLIFLILLSYYRSPFIFINGRFFSGDLTYHFLSSNLSFFDSLTYVDFSPRYMLLISNISSLISSRLFDLKHAQYVSVYLCFLIYLRIFYQILFKNSYLFKKNYQKYLGALICLVAPVMSFEIWLNVINLQVYLGILGLVILFTKEEENNYIDYFLLIIGALSGIYVCLLTPLFFLKYLVKKNSSNLICFLILFFCSLIQFVLIFYYSMKVNPIEVVGSSALTLNNTSLTLSLSKFEIISYYYNVVVRAFIGSSIPIYLVSFFEINLSSTFFNEDHKNLLFISSVTSLIVLIFSSLFFFISIESKKEKRIYFSLIVLFILVSLVVIFGGDTYSLHGRYACIPGIILIFSFLYLSNESKIKWVRLFSLFLITLTIVSGLIDFRYKKFINYLDCINCPNWSEEVRKYKLDKNYKPKNWPYHKQYLSN